ncbi:antibiotic biosynthesis monooxygenase [Rhodobacteraceae bacterium]|nr:antibiotic biosynthesis monooxygenase [Paracoccaceae bacterium]
MTRLVVARIVPVKGAEDRLHPMVEALAKDVRAEPGNLRFEVYQEGDSATYLILEEYRDDQAVKEHMASAHTRAFNAALIELAEGGASVVTDLRAVAQ